jgi:hypothetical protein
LRIHNDASGALQLDDAWLPHGRFRGEGHVALNTEVPAGESRVVELTVSAAEPPGTIVENAFLVLRARRGDKSWRIFARMRVEFDSRGKPNAIVESVTAQSLQ